MSTDKKHYPKGQHPNQIAARHKMGGTSLFNGTKLRRAKWNAAAADYRKRLRDAHLDGEPKPRTLTGGYVKKADRPEAKEQKEPQ